MCVYASREKHCPGIRGISLCVRNWSVLVGDRAPYTQPLHIPLSFDSSLSVYLAFSEFSLCHLIAFLNDRLLDVYGHRAILV